MPKNESAARCYLPAKSVITVDGQTAVSYGIGVVEDNFLVDVVQDISLDQQFVCHLAEMCNAGELSPCHLHDIIEDALN